MSKSSVTRPAGGAVAGLVGAACLWLGAATGTVAGAAEPELRPGRWLMTMSVDVEGVPFSMQAVTAPTCMDADDAHWGVDGAGIEGKGSCSFGNRRVDGDWVRYEMVCDDDAATTGSFAFRPAAESVQGTGVVRTGSAMIRQAWSGERTGDC